MLLSTSNRGNYVDVFYRGEKENYGLYKTKTGTRLREEDSYECLFTIYFLASCLLLFSFIYIYQGDSNDSENHERKIKSPIFNCTVIYNFGKCKQPTSQITTLYIFKNPEDQIEMCRSPLLTRDNTAASECVLTFAAHFQQLNEKNICQRDWNLFLKGKICLLILCAQEE